MGALTKDADHAAQTIDFGFKFEQLGAELLLHEPRCRLDQHLCVEIHYFGLWPFCTSASASCRRAVVS